MPRDPVLLTALLVDNPLCLACTASQAALTLEAAETALTVISRALPMQRHARVCPACGVPGTVFVLPRPVTRRAGGGETERP